MKLTNNKKKELENRRKVLLEIISNILESKIQGRNVKIIKCTYNIELPVLGLVDSGDVIKISSNNMNDIINYFVSLPIIENGVILYGGNFDNETIFDYLDDEFKVYESRVGEKCRISDTINKPINGSFIGKNCCYDKRDFIEFKVSNEIYHYLLHFSVKFIELQEYQMDEFMINMN